MAKALALLVLTSAFVSLPGWADKGSVNGFLSVSYGLVDGNSYYDLDLEDSELMVETGINGRYRLSERISFAGQLIYRNKGNTQKEEVRLDYANLDVGLGQHFNGQHSLLLGRVKNTMGLYAQTLELPVSRPSIILPQSIYNEATRNLIVSGDGFNLKSFYSFANSTLETNVIVAVALIDQQFAENMYSDINDSMENDYYVTAGLKYETGGNWYFGYDYLGLELDHEVADNSLYQEGFVRLDRHYFYARYSAEKWELAAEYLYQLADQNQLLPKNFVALAEFANADPTLPDVPFSTRNDLKGDGGYVQFSYFATPSTTLYAVYDMVYRDTGDRDGREAEAASAQLAQLSDSIAAGGGPDFQYSGITRHSRFQKTLTLGVSWEPSPDWQLMLEYHDIRGTANMPPLINKQAEPSEPTSSIVAFQASYRF